MPIDHDVTGHGVPVRLKETASNKTDGASDSDSSEPRLLSHRCHRLHDGKLWGVIAAKPARNNFRRPVARQTHVAFALSPRLIRLANFGKREQPVAADESIRSTTDKSLQKQ
jgi:hypothetical protein